MTDWYQKAGYQQQLYENRVSYKNSGAGVEWGEREYQRWAAATRGRLRGWLPEDRGTPILDMGCGPGNFLYLLEQQGYSDIVGVDLSPKKIHLAQQWCPQAKVIQGDVRDTLIENPGHFGLITGFDLIEHFQKEEILPFLTLVVQALKAGGRVIFQTPNAGSPWAGALAYGDFSHEWFFTPVSLATLLDQVGLAGYEARPCGPHIHGLKSLVRVVLWKIISLGTDLVILAEAGGRSTGIYTRVFLGTAIKQ
ncbi:MAG: class I SAM-dependent methyltransferase [Desulfobaccales bacterium]